MVVSFVKNNLWRYVLGSPTERPRLAPESNALGKTKVHLLSNDRPRRVLTFSTAETHGVLKSVFQTLYPTML